MAVLFFQKSFLEVNIHQYLSVEKFSCTGKAKLFLPISLPSYSTLKSCYHVFSYI